MRSVPSYIFFLYKTCFSNFCSVCDKPFILLWYGVRRCCPVVISHCLTDAYHSSFSSVFCCRFLSQSQFPSLCKCVYFEMFHVKHMPNDRKINGRKKENIEKDKKKLWWWKGRQLPKQGIVTEKTNGIHGRGMSLDREKKWRQNKHPKYTTETETQTELLSHPSFIYKVYYFSCEQCPLSALLPLYLARLLVQLVCIFK